MKVLITGGGGFVGRNLQAYLSGRHEVLAPRRAELDLADSEAVRAYLRAHQPDIVLHAAVKPGHRNAADVSGQLYSNSQMFFNLARNDDQFGKLLFFSSGLVYGLNHYQPKMKESYFDAHMPEDEGGLSKYVIAKYIEKAENMVELRPFSIFGPHEEYAIRFISNAICKAVYDLPITIKQNRRYDFVWIGDVCKATEYFMTHQAQHKAYNISPDRSMELLEVAQLVRRVAGKEHLDIKIAKEGMALEYSGDNSRIKEETEIEFTPLEQGVRQLYDWYVSHKSEINYQSLLVDK